MAERTATAIWEGDLMSGQGRVRGGTGAFGELEVSWPARTEEPGGKTSPEELLAAAEASCFSMALSHGLAEEGHPPERLEVSAACTFDKVEDGFGITKMAIQVTGRVPGIDEDAFRKAAEGAKDGCPVSKALAGNVALSVDARLEG